MSEINISSQQDLDSYTPTAGVESGAPKRTKTVETAETAEASATTASSTKREKVPHTADQVDVDKMVDELTELATKLVDDKGEIRASILNRIIKLLIELVPILQHVGMSQATALKLPTAMQELYTRMIASQFIYTKENSSGYFDDKNQDRDERLRGEKNQEMGIKADKLRSYRDQWADIAKRQQANINTTNEGVNQQIDMITTFFQQLRELTSVILR